MKKGFNISLPIPKKLLSLRYKLIGGFLIPIIFIILLGVVSYQKAAASLSRSFENTTVQTISMTSDYINFGFKSIDEASVEYINDKNINTYFLDQFSESKASTQKKLIQSMLDTKSTADDFVESIYLLSDNVDSISESDNNKSDLSKGAYSGFLETDAGQYLSKNKMESLWLGNNAYLDQRLGTAAFDYSLRLIKHFPNCKALTVIDASKTNIQKIIKNVKFDTTGILGFVTADGKEIFAEDKQESVFYQQDFFKKVAEGTEAAGYKNVTYQEKAYLFFYSKIGQTGALICALIPKSTISGQADAIGRVTVLIVILACLIATLIGFIISIGIDKTIRDIISKLRKAAKGDLTVDFHTARKDELKILIDELQFTFSNMKNLVGKVDQLSENVTGSSAKMNDTSVSFVKSSEDISNSIKEIERGIIQQAYDSQECLMQMDNLSKKMEIVSDNTREISKIAEDAKISINAGTECTNELNDQMKATLETTTQIINAIENLAEKSMTVSKITQVINEIANQTNLLSLNASIEAARAGEFGRGFSVVADEIRVLADESKNSAENIRKIINSIQEDTKHAAEIAKKAGNVLSMQMKAVNNTTSSYRNINDSVEQLMLYLDSIAENVVNMEESRGNTLGAIESISAVLEEIAASSGTVNQNAEEQLKEVENLKQSAEILNNNASDLSSAIQKFII